MAEDGLPDDVPALIGLWDFAVMRLLQSITAISVDLLWHKEPDVESIAGIFRHAYERELFFYELILQAEGIQPPARERLPRHASAERLQTEAEEAHRSLRAALLERAPYVWQKQYTFRGTWGSAELTGESIVWRLIMHSSYHMGQIYYARQLLDIPGPANTLEGI